LLLLALAAGALATIIFLPQGQVELILRTAPLLVDEELRIKPGIATENSIPGTGFAREVPVSGMYSVASTEVIGQQATGPVQLVNRTFDEQKIKERSRLETADGQLFFMISSATIPGDSRTTVEVEAAKAGPEGNIEPQRLDFVALPEDARQVVYAEVVTPLTGGSGETVAVVKEIDLERAQQQAGSEARSAVEDSIRQELAEGWALLEESWTAEVSDFSAGAAVGDNVQELPFSGSVQVTVLAYQVAAVEDKLRGALQERLSDEFILFPGPLSYTTDIRDVDLAQQSATVSARVTHTTIPDLSLETLRSKILGRSETEAREYLTGLPGVRAVSVNVWPFWARSLPRIENRISIDLVPERQP